MKNPHPTPETLPSIPPCGNGPATDDTRPEAEFRFRTFNDQLAVGTGFGLRFDLSFFILRADLGLPLRRPYPVDGSYWLGSGSERRKNATFNFAIGYPF